MDSFGLDRPGTAYSDSEISEMSRTYSGPGHAYFVLEEDGVLVGGGGIGPLAGGDPGVCELRKMYLIPEARGRGLGHKVLAACLSEARKLGYETCYLETIAEMTAARALYAKAGFHQICSPMGQTGHCDCDVWYSMKL